MNHYIAKYKRLGIDRIFNGEQQTECAAAIATAMIQERIFLNEGKEATAPEWGDRQSTMRACHGIADWIMRGDYAVAWVGDNESARRLITADGIEVHRSIRELITACIARHLPGSRWVQILEQRIFVVVKTV